ncbi:MAG: hypothetical protein K1X42_14115 [Opitutaceae bacterium]|nr:hypothetical protein [Opitutaceae bacterium]
MTDSHSDGVLFAFSVEPRHDRATLERYLRLYPELAEDLIDLAHELRMVEGLGPSEQVVDSDDTARAAWREYAAAASPKAPESIFARFKGQTFVALANKLNIPRSVLMALRDRLVLPDSIPTRFLTRLSGEMGASLETVRSYLQQAGAVSPALSFKADEKPSVPAKVTFKDLLESSQLTESQAATLQQDFSSDERD